MAMRADENASIPKEKANRASYSRLPDEDAFFATMSSPQEEGSDEEAERKQRRKERWQSFKTP
jgi:hypothetical protein